MIAIKHYHAVIISNKLLVGVLRIQGAIMFHPLLSRGSKLVDHFLEGVQLDIVRFFQQFL